MRQARISFHPRDEIIAAREGVARCEVASSRRHVHSRPRSAALHPAPLGGRSNRAQHHRRGKETFARFFNEGDLVPARRQPVSTACSTNGDTYTIGTSDGVRHTQAGPQHSARMTHVIGDAASWATRWFSRTGGSARADLPRRGLPERLSIPSRGLLACRTRCASSCATTTAPTAATSGGRTTVGRGKGAQHPRRRRQTSREEFR